MDKFPRITIIVPWYNQAEYLDETLSSIIDQAYPNLELFVIDGGSTDTSVEVIERFSSAITWWVSEKDQGQSHAINKGLKRATGDVINWINSDDILAEGSLNKIAYIFESNPGLHCLIGGLEYFNHEKKWIPQTQQTFTTLTEAYGSFRIRQPSMFYSKKAVAYFGELNSELHYCMDLDWWYKFIGHFGIESTLQISDTLAFFRIHHSSKSSTAFQGFLKEKALLIYSIALSQSFKHENRTLEILFNDIVNFSNAVSNFKYPEITSSAVRSAIFSLVIVRHSEIYTKAEFTRCVFALRVIRKSFPEFILDPEYIKLKKVLRFGWFWFRINRKLKSKFS